MSNSNDTPGPILSMELTLGMEDIELDGGLGALFEGDGSRLSISSSDFAADIILPDTEVTANRSEVSLKVPSQRKNGIDLCSPSNPTNDCDTPLRRRSRRISWNWLSDFEHDCNEMVNMHPSVFMDGASSSDGMVAPTTGNEDRLSLLMLNGCSPIDFDTTESEDSQTASSPTQYQNQMPPLLSPISHLPVSNLPVMSVGTTSNNRLKAKATKSNKKKNRVRVLDESRAIDPKDIDVLFGRGGLTNKHPGNNRFRQKALDLWPQYRRSSKEEKQKITDSLVETIKSEGCRFLEKGKDGQWHEVVSGGRRKASQTFRDIARRSG